MNNSRRLFALAVALVLCVVARAFAATTTGTSLTIAGLEGIRLTVDAATTGDVVATDAGTIASKRGQIVRVVSNAETKFILTRVQVAPNGVFVDEIAAETTTALAARIAAFNLATASPGHPSPTHDSVDDALSAAMVGYTGS